MFSVMSACLSTVDFAMWPPHDVFKYVYLEPSEPPSLSSHPGPDPLPDIFKVVHCVGCTVSKRVVGIRLKCILVTARKQSLGQGKVFTGVCHSFSLQSGWRLASQHTSQVTLPGDSASRGVCIGGEVSAPSGGGDWIQRDLHPWGGMVEQTHPRYIGYYGTQSTASGTHPPGMLTWIEKK